MDGYDLLKEELINRGFKTQQVNAKIVAQVLDIITNDEDNTFTQIFDKEKRIKQLDATIQALESRIAELKQRTNVAETEYRRFKDKTADIRTEEQNKLQEDLDDFFRALDSCETAEARDLLKRAQIYRNSVTIDTKYDNTAYIKGLGFILSSGNSGCIDKCCIDRFEKVDEEIPRPSEWVAL